MIQLVNGRIMVTIDDMTCAGGYEGYTGTFATNGYAAVGVHSLKLTPYEQERVDAERQRAIKQERKAWERATRTGKFR